MNTIAIILSGGVGTRLGSNIPKQYIEINNQPIISYTLKQFYCNKNINAIIIVCDPLWDEYIRHILSKQINQLPVFFSPPGETRQYSILNALNTAIQHFHPDDIVIIHDAARPLVSQDLINECFKNCTIHDGVLPVIPVKDTIYQSFDKSHISALLPRATLFAGQSPEAFKLGKYLQAHQQLTHQEILEINGSSELAYKQGIQIKLIPGDETNFKITTTEDLERFKLFIQNESECTF